MYEYAVRSNGCRRRRSYTRIERCVSAVITPLTASGIPPRIRRFICNIGIVGADDMEGGAGWEAERRIKVQVPLGPSKEGRDNTDIEIVSLVNRGSSIRS